MGIKYHGISAKILPYVQPPLLSKNISELGFFLGAGGGGMVWGAALHSQNPSHPSKKNEY